MFFGNLFNIYFLSLINIVNNHEKVIWQTKNPIPNMEKDWCRFLFCAYSVSMSIIFLYNVFISVKSPMIFQYVFINVTKKGIQLLNISQSTSWVILSPQWSDRKMLFELRNRWSAVESKAENVSNGRKHRLRRKPSKWIAEKSVAMKN